MLVWVALRRTADLKFQIPNPQFAIRNSCGGEGGIRTHGTVPRSQHFQCCQFNHSCTSPKATMNDERGTMNNYSAFIVHTSALHLMAERVGFEPTVGVNPLRFSRPVH